jgi:hypothetical protein
MLLALLALVACAGPLDAALEHEAAWGSLDRVEAETGLQLARLEAGDPVGRWPRVVVRLDGIDLDDRAWALSLALPAEDRATLLVEAPGVVTLDAGRLREDQHSGPLVPALEAPLQALRDRMRAVPEGGGAPTPDGFLLVPDARVPWETVASVEYTVLQAGFDGVTFAGRVGEHLRTPYTSSPAGYGQCPREAVVHQVDGGWLLNRRDRPTVSARAGACAPLPLGDLGPRLRDVATACDEGPACLDLLFLPDADLPMGTVLAGLAAVWSVGEPLRQGPMVWGAGREPEVCTAVLGPTAIASSDGAFCAHAPDDAKAETPTVPDQRALRSALEAILAGGAGAP